MQYSAINIQGNIISGEILEKIRLEDINHQNVKDFGLEKNVTIRDEIGIAWAATRAYWSAFKMRRERLKDSDTGTSETRQGWIIPFLNELGYNLERSTAEIINGKSYAISHRASNRGGFPVHIVGINQSLDKRADVGGTRLSPHALIQEYLNNHSHLYAITTNGRFLRLLRDATRLSRLSYLEFDLERIMEEDQFAEFALLYRLLHASRMPENQDSGDESIIEYYHQEALSSGSRIREKLSEAVEQSLKLLANGLLKHPNNQELRNIIINESLKPDDYYNFLLRLVYRILFLMVIEERHLIYPKKLDEETNKKRTIYYDFYSINRLTKLAEKLIYVDPHKTDLWKSLFVTFNLFEDGFYGEKLGLKPLGSGLFSPNALGVLKELSLDNGTLLKVLQLLITFENENQQRVRVNYADLDVEEFGSVYEGLLEYDPNIRDINGQPTFIFVKGDGRSSSGSHYTPQELVNPLIKHSLDYIIEERLEKPEEYIPLHLSKSLSKRQQQEQALLAITVCDVACGSGHILLSAARRIALELARVRTNEDQPTPPAIRKATRHVIRHCIYGVDLNPLAVELCKVALWLEAHNPGEPLNFLDHRIKCGNSIVGLAHKEELKNGIADEAFKTLPGDEKEVATTFRNRNKAERKLIDQTTINFDGVVEESLSGILEKFDKIANLPEDTPDEIITKQKSYNKLIDGPRWWKLKTLADMQIAQFFIPKTIENRDRLITDSIYRQYLNGKKTMQDQASALATAKAQEKRFFHWFLEFPEIFANGGFDCVLGNPPFLGGQRISGSYGDRFLENIKYQFDPIGAVDMVTYFFRRIFAIIKENGFQSLISTNTIAQGKVREDGLDRIVESGGVINHAVKGMKWPGEAAVEVSLVTITKQPWKGPFILASKEVKTITPYLDDALTIGNPFPLNKNDGKSFQGSIVLGKGFVLEPDEAKALIEKDSRNKDVIFPYLNGNDLNNNPDQTARRWVVNFFDWSEEKAKQYPDCYNILEKLVKPERQRWKTDKEGNEIIGEYALRKPLPQKWWIHGEKRPKLYSTIKSMEKVLVSCRVSKYVNQSFIDVGSVFDVATSVVIRDKYWEYAFLQSTLHRHWAWRYGSTMKFDIRYTSNDCIDTFPILDNITSNKITNLENVGQNFHKYRYEVMQKIQLGLTKTYNAFHAPEIIKNIKTTDLENKTNKEITKKFGKEIWNLWNHLQKTEGTCSWEEAVKGIEELRRLHIEMDSAVLEAYGWHEDSDKWGEAINLKHGFYEMDYLAENDRVRFTIHPDAREEVLKRLLQLNHELYEEEIKQGLHKKRDVEKFYAQKEQPVPSNVIYIDGKPKRKTTRNKTVKKDSSYNDSVIIDTPNLFNQPEKKVSTKKPSKTKSKPKKQSSTTKKVVWLNSTKEFKVTISDENGEEYKYHVSPNAHRGKFTEDYKQILLNSGLAVQIIDRQEGDTFTFGVTKFTIDKLELLS